MDTTSLFCNTHADHHLRTLFQGNKTTFGALPTIAAVDGQRHAYPHHRDDETQDFDHASWA